MTKRAATDSLSLLGDSDDVVYEFEYEIELDSFCANKQFNKKLFSGWQRVKNTLIDLGVESKHYRDVAADKFGK
jgi:hypothetical protein